MGTIFKNGVLDVSMLPFLWKEEHQTVRVFLLRLLEKYGLVVPCFSDQGSTPDTYIVPSMLPIELPDDNQAKLAVESDPYPHVLVILFQNYVPHAFFELLLGSIFSSLQESRGRELYAARHEVWEDLSRSHAFLTVNDGDRTLEFELRGPVPLQANITVSGADLSDSEEPIDGFELVDPKRKDSRSSRSHSQRTPGRVRVRTESSCKSVRLQVLKAVEKISKWPLRGIKPEIFVRGRNGGFLSSDHFNSVLESGLRETKSDDRKLNPKSRPMSVKIDDFRYWIEDQHEIDAKKRAEKEAAEAKREA